jgi:hypothetical protein
MKRLDVSGAVRHTYIYIYVIKRQRVNDGEDMLKKGNQTNKAFKYILIMSVLSTEYN